MTAQDERYAFEVEWYDPNAELMKTYQLFYFTKDGTIEMYDTKNHRTFLSRCKCDNLRLEQLYIGSTVNVFSRQLNFVGYGDQFTAKKLVSNKEKTLGLIKPDAVSKIGEILNIINRSGMLITNLKMVRMSRTDAMDFYKEHSSKPFFNSLISYIAEGPIVAMEIMGNNAIAQWRQILGPTDSTKAKAEAPTSIRAQFGLDNTKNACHGSDSAESAQREISFFFSKNSCPNTATFSDCTCCIIKPHCIEDGQAGNVIEKIMETGFEISAMQMFYLEKANAEEFLEVYKGVVQEYASMVQELMSGPCIAMEIRAQNAPHTFREFTGPADPEIARHLRPRTLRAIFGKNKIQNSVHCTDLPEDGLLEVEYFFKVL